LGPARVGKVRKKPISPFRQTIHTLGMRYIEKSLLKGYPDLSICFAASRLP
jgi:hypothetical protein